MIHYTNQKLTMPPQPPFYVCTYVPQESRSGPQPTFACAKALADVMTKVSNGANVVIRDSHYEVCEE
jgi:hypothetical protein